MSTRNTVIGGALAFLMLVAGTATMAAVQYDAILEWDGPYFRVINDTDKTGQLVDTPVVDFKFNFPTAVAAREHTAANERDVVYVVDSGNNRIQQFEVNAGYVYDDQVGFTFQVGGATAASEWDGAQIHLAEWADPAVQWIVPGSEVVKVNDVEWTRVDDLTGLTAADMVYTIDYDDTSEAPEIVFPASSLDANSTFTARYVLTDNQTAAADAFGIGDVDYGNGEADPAILVEINESTGGGAPSTFEQLRSIALIADEAASSTDDLYVLDTSDASENLFVYSVTDAGVVSFGELYDDALSTPWDVAVAETATASTDASATLADTGPFDTAVTITDDSQVTGHTYTFTVAGGDVSVSDATTGRVLATAADWATIYDDPYLGIPGISLDINAAIGTTVSMTTVKAVPQRFLFVADTGNDRIKVIGVNDAPGAGDWLPGDTRTVVTQPTGAGTIGDDATEDYSESTPATVTEDLTFWTNTFPLEENTLTSITFDPSGTPEVWTIVDDILLAGPADQVYEVNSDLGFIRFGDGIHGELPPASTEFTYSYTTTPDVVRYGSAGTGPGRFSGPKGVAARWNSAIGAFDVYVADTGNNRIQKLAFYPEDASLNLPARMEYVTEWSTAASLSDLLGAPSDIIVQSDGTDVWVAVADAGNNRLLTYDDAAAASVGGTSAPSYDSALGGVGSTLGLFNGLTSITFMTNGSDLDLYVVDETRGVVTKYEEAPTPTIAVGWVGLPDCFPPTGAYTLDWSSTNVPDGGYIDFYYDTASSWSADTSNLIFSSQSVGSAALTATWSFGNTVSGIPADGTYYLFARMYNSVGNLVANDATTSSELLCIDSSLLPTQEVADQIDTDNTLYLQNNLLRSVELNVVYPDSVITVGYDGTFDATKYEIVSIAQGTAWDGIGAISTQFNATFDNTNGTFQVASSALDTPVGLTSNGPHNIATVTLRAKANSIDLANPTSQSTIDIGTQSSTRMTDINGESPSSPVEKDMDVRIAFLGDISGDSGTGGSLPNTLVNPDGLINFEDQMAFTIGYSGTGTARDRIADIGPVSGTAPNVISVPDGQWDVDDLIAFGTMFSWAANAGITTQGGAPAPAEGGSGASTLLPNLDARPFALGADVPGKARVYVTSEVENALPGSFVTVDVMASGLDDMIGGLISLGYDASQLRLVDIQQGEIFANAENALWFDFEGPGWVQISATRTDQNEPGYWGDGALAHLTFEILEAVTSEVTVRYDLRSAFNAILSRGAAAAGPLADLNAGFQLYSNYPNPVQSSTNIVFSIPSDGQVELNVFDPSGRRVRALVNEQKAAGYHVVSFNGRSDENDRLAAGVYFYRLQSDGQTLTKKMVIAR